MSSDRKKVSLPLDTAGALALAPADSSLPDGFVPATKAQVAYWRELCGVLSGAGSAGVRDTDWPADLAPSKPTLAALVGRGLIVRRKRAWHLKRHWYTLLSQLRATAVDTPRLTIADRPAPGLPTYGELQVWESLCRWLDGQPKCRAPLPMLDVPGVNLVTSGMLQSMRRQKLLRHTGDCHWALSSKWKTQLLALWHGVTKATGEHQSTVAPEACPSSVAAGLDTWYLNRLDEHGLSPRLKVQLDDLQEVARHNDEEVDSPWRYDGMPLRMYRAGVSATQGGGVSWSYILRNPSLTLLIRKVPLGGIVLQARLGSECLWRLTPLRALDELDVLVRRMWSLRRPSTQAHWQVSQAHLAHDVANTTIELDQLERYVSRSRRQSLYEGAQADLQSLYRLVDGQREGQGDDGIFDPFLDLPWEDPFVNETDELLNDLFADPDDAEERQVPELVAVEERAVTAHRWGRRLSGVTWSPGGAISFVQYDKVLEGRLRNKRFMEPIWRAQRWDGKAPVTRYEARLRRDALRVLGLPPELRASLDNPWTFLQHLSAIWAYVVGHAPGGETATTCPAVADQTDIAWLRRVVPEDDINRSRWPTDPTWQVVQAAPFTDAPPTARRLLRREQHLHSVWHLDVGAYGYLVSRTALLHPDGETYDVSQAARELVTVFTHIAALPGKELGELVRERRRARGLSIRPAAKVLPPAPLAFAVPSDKDLAALDATMEQAFVTDPQLLDELHAARVRLTERRLQEVLLQLDESACQGAGASEIARLEAAYDAEMTAYRRLAHSGG